jgi:hypothetical protein
MLSFSLIYISFHCFSSSYDDESSDDESDEDEVSKNTFHYRAKIVNTKLLVAVSLLGGTPRMPLSNFRHCFQAANSGGLPAEGKNGHALIDKLFSQ